MISLTSLHLQCSGKPRGPVPLSSCNGPKVGGWRHLKVACVWHSALAGISAGAVDRTPTYDLPMAAGLPHSIVAEFQGPASMRPRKRVGEG